MFKDYLQQLKEIQQDKAVFQSKNQKKSLVKTLSRQQDKYQAYIIDQMSSQNRIIAAHHLAILLDTSLKPVKAVSFKMIAQYSKNLEHQVSFTHLVQDKRDNSVKDKEIISSSSISVDLVLLKMSLSSVVRYLQNRQKAEKEKAFKEVLQAGKKKKKTQKLIKIFERMGLRQGLHSLKKVHSKSEQVEHEPFSDQFSMIVTQKSQMKKVNPDESYLSFMLDKENANLDCPSCKQSYQLNLQQEKEIIKMKEELSYLKHLLTEKNLEIKKKQDQIDILKQKSGEEEISSDFSEKNSSYYSQLEKQVLGEKRTRKCGSIASNTSRIPKQEISKELLGKYMRETFQLKETMDVAREMCLDLQESIAFSQRHIIQKIVSVLSQGEQISLVDEY